MQWQANEQVVVFANRLAKDLRALRGDLRERHGGTTAGDIGGEVLDGKAEDTLAIVRTRGEQFHGDAREHIVERQHDRAPGLVACTVHLDPAFRGPAPRRLRAGAARGHDLPERTRREGRRRSDDRRLGRWNIHPPSGEWRSVPVRLGFEMLPGRGIGLGFEEMVEESHEVED